MSMDSHSSPSCRSTSSSFGSNSSSSSPFPTFNYSLRISGISPENAKSRVETQTRVALTLIDRYGERDSFYHTLHIPPLLLAKDKPKKTSIQRSPQIHSDRALYLKAFVKCATDPHKKLFVCDTCVRRELLRANRKKGGAATDSAIQLENKFLIINSPETLIFEHGQVELPIRITCYSRHHDEREGFKVTFQVCNNVGEVIASQTSPPLMITDDHKTAKRSQIRPSKKRKNTDDSDSSASQVYGVPSSLHMTCVPSPPSGFKTPESTFDIQSLNMPMYPLTPTFDTVDLSQISPQTMQQSYFQDFADPRIVKVVPSEGPVTGGIEVTVLGERFNPGCLVILGGRIAHTEFFSETTLTCILPPSAVPGPVPVQLKNYDSIQPGSFVYRNDSDRALLELALQIIGHQVTGKLEDAINIAMHIVSQQSSPARENFYSNQQEYLLKALAVLDNPSPFDSQIDMRTSTGHTLLHLVCYNNLYKIVPLLLRHGASPHAKDHNGLCPLHYAAWMNSKESVEALLCVSNIWARTKTGDTALDLARLAGASDIERLILRRSPKEGTFNRSLSFPTLQALISDYPSSDLSSFISCPVSRRASFSANQTCSNSTGKLFSPTKLHSSESASQIDVQEKKSTLDEQVQQRVKDIFNTMWLSLSRSSDILRRPGDYFPQTIPALPTFWSEPPPEYQEVVPQSVKENLSKSGKSQQSTVEDDEEVVRAADLIRASTKDRMVFFFWLPVLVASIGLLYYTCSFPKTAFIVQTASTTQKINKL